MPAFHLVPSSTEVFLWIKHCCGPGCRPQGQFEPAWQYLDKRVNANVTLLLLASFNLNFANLQCFQKFTRRWRGLPHSPSTVGAWSECQGALRVLLTFCKMLRLVFNSCTFWRYCNLGLQEEVSVGRNRKSNAKVCDGPNVSRNHLKLIRLVILSFLGVYLKS